MSANRTKRDLSTASIVSALSGKAEIGTWP